METNLLQRDIQGVDDMVLLEDYLNEEAFLDNLEKRFKKDIIYTYIGPLLVSVNPYKSLPLYSEEAHRQYRGLHLFEAAPHLYAVTDAALTLIREERRDQCILISGESGAGKTEASKYVLEYVSAAAPGVESVKERMLGCNPALEAYGNARTTRNGNSSRFGKYMDVEFDVLGAPVGAHILHFLLEKARVAAHMPGERNFHSFYQLLAGADDELLEKLDLSRKCAQYRYLHATSIITNEIDEEKEFASDAKQFVVVKRALDTLGMDEKEQTSMHELLASVLHLGNVNFEGDAHGNAIIVKEEDLQNVRRVTKLLGTSEEQLVRALTWRTIEARGERVETPLSLERAAFARDALAKALYERLFSWLVRWLNATLKTKNADGTELSSSTRDSKKGVLLGILDIYGFEILAQNGFEQLCINLCNEHLQQLVVELTLKSEQEEYRREGIEWEQVTFFDNKTICEMVESTILPLLDEEGVRPGEPSDIAFLQKMDKDLDHHAHYASYALAELKKKRDYGREEFRVLHYAGEVTYQVTGFVERNIDPLFVDLRQAMFDSGPFARELFKGEEDLIHSKKRPPTVAYQFRQSVAKLMTTLLSKEPSYIRCIKPNDHQRHDVFDRQVVLHQIHYLGLMENLRVRRAGFAYRRVYPEFVRRYRCIAPETWPTFNGDARTGTMHIINHLKYGEDDYRMGHTKIFIRHARTLFDTEDALHRRRNELATFLQSQWRGYIQRQRYKQARARIIMVQRFVRGFLGRREAVIRRRAAKTLYDFAQAFIRRNLAEDPEGERFRRMVRVAFLNRLAKQLPKSVLDKSWPKSPVCCQEASAQLHKIHTRVLVRRYIRSLTTERKEQLQLKVLAEKLFKGRKQGYTESVPVKFTRQVGLETAQLRAVEAALQGLGIKDKVAYMCSATKYDRRGYKPRPRILVATNTTLLLLTDEYKLKYRYMMSHIEAIVVTPLSDSLVLFRIPTSEQKDKKTKGDLIVELPERHVIEAVTYIIAATNKPQTLRVEADSQVTHTYRGNKEGHITLRPGGNNHIERTKKTLTVVGVPLPAQ